MGIFKDIKKKLLKDEKPQDEKAAASVPSQTVSVETKKKPSQEKSKNSTKKSETAEKKGEKKPGEKRSLPKLTGIILRPSVTEKASMLAEKNQYIFVVSEKSNKIQIARAIESMYQVKPINVQTVRVKGKWVRYGKSSGQKKNWKKAIVTLKKGEKIEIFENA